MARGECTSSADDCIDGTHHYVSTERLHRYLAQFDSMYSYCRETDPSEEIRRIVENVAGRRPPYRSLGSDA